MFSRISLIRFDVERLDKAHRMWLSVSVPAALAQKSCRKMRGFRSLDDPSLMIIVSEWDSREDADAYMYSPAHDRMMEGYGTLIQGIVGRYPCALIE